MNARPHAAGTVVFQFLDFAAGNDNPDTGFAAICAFLTLLVPLLAAYDSVAGCSAAGCASAGSTALSLVLILVDFDRRRDSGFAKDVFRLSLGLSLPNLFHLLVGEFSHRLQNFFLRLGFDFVLCELLERLMDDRLRIDGTATNRARRSAHHWDFAGARAA
jgi:hypothetical protein